MTEHKLPTVLEGIVAKRRTHLAGIRERIAHVDVDKLEPSRVRFLRRSMAPIASLWSANLRRHPSE